MRALSPISGADDHQTNPLFSMEEALTRVRVRLRRDRDAFSAGAESELLSPAGISMNTATPDIQQSGRTISLTAREYDWLCTLLEDPRRVPERQALLRALWG